MTVHRILTKNMGMATHYTEEHLQYLKDRIDTLDAELGGVRTVQEVLGVNCSDASAKRLALSVGAIMAESEELQVQLREWQGIHDDLERL